MKEELKEIEVDYSGEKVKAFDVTPENIEPKNISIKLLDGNTLVITRVVYKIVKLEKTDKEGNPIYQFKVNDMATIISKNDGE